MTDDAQRARRRAHNAHALARCNAMGRTAGSTLWQPLRMQDGKCFMPDGSELSEHPIEWRSERLETILDEMDAIQAVAPVADPGKAYVESLDAEKWKAETSAQFVDGAAANYKFEGCTWHNTAPPTARMAGEEITQGDAVYIGQDGKVLRASPPEFDWIAVGPNGPMPKEEYDGLMRAAYPLSDPDSVAGRKEIVERIAGDVYNNPPSTISLEDLEKAIMTDHAPMPVKGYTTQSDARLAQVNANKEIEERVLRVLDDLGRVEDVDKRWLAIARTHIEQGFMSVNRAIFQPQRAKLPGDVA